MKTTYILLVITLYVHGIMAKTLNPEPSTTDLQEIWDRCSNLAGPEGSPVDFNNVLGSNKRPLCLGICFVHYTSEYLQEDDNVNTEELSRQYNCRLE